MKLHAWWIMTFCVTYKVESILMCRTINVWVCSSSFETEVILALEVTAL